MAEGIRIYDPKSFGECETPCKGLQVKHEDGICKVRLHYTADPDKDPTTEKGRKWFEEATTRMSLNPLQWMREMEMDANAMSGQTIYPEFGDIHMVDPFEIPKTWTRYMSLDSGIRNQTAGLWASVNPMGEIYLYREYYESDRDVRANAEAIKYLEFIKEIKSKAYKGKDKTVMEEIYERYIDPSTQNRSALTGTSIFDEYRNYGLYFIASVNDAITGIQRVKQKLRLSDVTKKPRLFVFKNLINTIKEFKNYRWQKISADQLQKNNPAEKPQKVADHLMNALEYLMQADIQYVKTIEERGGHKRMFGGNIYEEYI